MFSFSVTCSLGHGLVAVFSLFWTSSGYVTISSSAKGKLREPDLCVRFIILNVLHCWSRLLRKKTLGRYGLHLIDHHLGFEAWDNMLSAVWIRSFQISLVLAFATPTTHTTPHSTHPPRSPTVPQVTVAFWTAATVLYRVHHRQSSFALISGQLHTSPALTNPPWQCECVPVCLSWGRFLKWTQLVSAGIINNK